MAFEAFYGMVHVKVNVGCYGIICLSLEVLSEDKARTERAGVLIPSALGIVVAAVVAVSVVSSELLYVPVIRQIRGITVL